MTWAQSLISQHCTARPATQETLSKYLIDQQPWDRRRSLRLTRTHCNTVACPTNTELPLKLKFQIRSNSLLRTGDTYTEVLCLLLLLTRETLCWVGNRGPGTREKQDRQRGHNRAGSTHHVTPRS